VGCRFERGALIDQWDFAVCTSAIMGNSDICRISIPRLAWCKTLFPVALMLNYLIGSDRDDGIETKERILSQLLLELCSS
jgi:hypothetical protein